jgi:hypothetical protein
VTYDKTPWDETSDAFAEALRDAHSWSHALSPTAISVMDGWQGPDRIPEVVTGIRFPSDLQKKVGK